MGAVGPPGDGGPEHCRDCGSFMAWVDKHDEIKELHDEALEKGVDPVEHGVPPGPWGYWECPQCADSDEQQDGGQNE